MQTTDKTHLMALISSLGRERQRLSEARNDGERALRAAGVAQIECEILEAVWPRPTSRSGTEGILPRLWISAQSSPPTE